jgi:hypothetical protein
MIAPTPPTTSDLKLRPAGIADVGARPDGDEIVRRVPRAELEAQQKRYMDERFGRNRPMNRKRRA